MPDAQAPEPEKIPKGHRRAKSLGGLFSRKGKTKHEDISPPIFGTPLEEVIRLQRSEGIDLAIPQVADSLIRYLEQEDILRMTGIFRVSGSTADIQRLKTQVDNGIPLDTSTIHDPYVASGLLKLYIRDLPENLLTFTLYSQFLDLQRQNPLPEMFIASVKTLFMSLPDANKALLTALMKLIRKIVQFSDENKMTSSNLAIVFAPTLLRSKEETLMSAMSDNDLATNFIQMLIENFDQIEIT